MDVDKGKGKRGLLCSPEGGPYYMVLLLEYDQVRFTSRQLWLLK